MKSSPHHQNRINRNAPRTPKKEARGGVYAGNRNYGLSTKFFAIFSTDLFHTFC